VKRWTTCYFGALEIDFIWFVIEPLRNFAFSRRCSSSTGSTYPTRAAISSKVRTSPAEPLAIFRKFKYSFRDLRSKPSAIFADIDRTSELILQAKVRLDPRRLSKSVDISRECNGSLPNYQIFKTLDFLWDRIVHQASLFTFSLFDLFHVIPLALPSSTA